MKPFALYIHGGGWSEGDPSEGYEPWACPLLERHGFLTESASYRLTTAAPHPAQLDDVRATIRRVRADHPWVGVWGFSAGGHLAALAALHEPVDAVALGSPITDLSIPGGLVALESDVTQGLLGGRNELAHEVSPVNHVRSDAPPFLIAHGTADTAVPFEHAVRMHAALQRVGARSELVAIDGADHAWLPSPGLMRFGELVLDFFQREFSRISALRQPSRASAPSPPT
jgi:acetyl esterase/lipase